MSAVRPLVLTLLVAASALAGVPGATADQADFFTLFEFRQLKFEFHPEGVPKSMSSDPEGSALAIYVVNVSVLDFDAYDLRQCMDGQSSCEYPVIWQSNRDGQVQAEEVASFEAAAGSVAQGIPEVSALTDMVQNNITVDGQASARPRVTALRFEGAEGPADSMEPIEAYVDVLARYGNDPKATRHEVKINDLRLFEKGFEYEQVVWAAAADKSNWVFKVDQASPEDARKKLAADGWFSNQATFEDYSAQGLTLVVEREGRTGGGSPAPGVFLALAAAALALVVLRRKNA